jgi:N-acetyl-anhydromuramyl-L-alanine amidase AmpD
MTIIKTFAAAAVFAFFVAAASASAAPTTRPAAGAAAPAEGRHPLKIIDKPMLRQSSTRPAGQTVDFVVLHFCSDVLQHPDHPYDVDRIQQIFAKAPASANYLIDRDGTVYRFVPESRAAWHAGMGSLWWIPSLKQMNARSIGIEMTAVGSENDMKLFGMKNYDAWAKAHPQLVGFSDKQYASLNELLKEIEQRHPAIKHDREHIIGHEEWAGRQRRTDPGELFDWTKIGLTKERPTTQP